NDLHHICRVVSGKPRISAVHRQAGAEVASALGFIAPLTLGQAHAHISPTTRQTMRQFQLSARRSGSADLPLHGGQVPRWLGDRMTRLGAVIAEAIVHHYGRDELLRRLAHPFWFQSFGAVMGMDWHSSGITTSVIGALKRGLTPLSGELGLHVCGASPRFSAPITLVVMP